MSKGQRLKERRFIKALGFDPDNLPDPDSALVQLGENGGALARLKSENAYLKEQIALSIMARSSITKNEARDLAVSIEQETTERAIRFMNERLTPYYAAISKLQTELRVVNALIITEDDPRKLRNLLRGKDIRISDALTELAGAERAVAPDGNLNPGFSDLEMFCGVRIEGIQLFVPDKITAQELRQRMLDSGGPETMDLFARLKDVDFGGRPSGITPWRYWLACRWRDYEAEHPKAPPKAVRTALIAEIEGSHDADMLDALHSLRGVETPPESGYAPPEAVSRYRRELFKAAGFERRRKQNDS